MTLEYSAQEVEHPVPTLTVAAVARRLGVAPATLRTWARRYELGPTQHTPGMHRRYSATDLTRLLIMRRLTHEGLSPGQAARRALEAEVGPGDIDPELLDLDPVGLDTSHLPSVGGGRVLPLPEASAAVRGLARAAMALDGRGVSEMLRRSIRTEGVVATWDRLAVPVLIGLGDRYAATNEGIEVEHLFSECVMGVLRGVTDQLHTPRAAATILLACIADEQHCLPSHAVASGLAERGIHARQLGVRVPPAALLAAVRRSGPGAVYLYAALDVHDISVLSEIVAVRPSPRLILGGPGWPHKLPPSVTRTTSLAEAINTIVATVL